MLHRAALLLLLLLPCAARADDDAPLTGELVLNVGDEHHSYDVQNLSAAGGVMRGADQSSQQKGEFNFVLRDMHQVDPFLLSWLSGPASAPRIGLSFRLASKPSANPAIGLVFDLVDVESTTISASYSEGQAQFVVSVSGAHLSINGVRM